MPWPLVHRKLVSEIDLATGFSASFVCPPPVFPNPLRETEDPTPRYLFGRLSENEDELLAHPRSGAAPAVDQTADVAHGRLFYCLDPVPDNASPPPDRFHTIGLYAQLQPNSIFRQWGYDTIQHVFPLIGYFEVSRAPFFPPIQQGIFQVPYRWRIRVFCENDGATDIVQPYRVCWRNGRW